MERNDEQLLLWLLRHPLQRDSDLALALQVHPTTIYRHLVHLEQAGLVEPVTPSGKTTRQRWYYLTNNGVQAVATLQGASSGALARAFGADEVGLLRLIARLPVVVLLQHVINGLVAHAPSIFCSPNGVPARLSWHWQRDWRHLFVSKGRTLSCSADAVLVVQRASQRRDELDNYFTLLFLADGGLTGMNDHRIIEQRLERLLRYRESAERTTHFQTMPAVAILVSHPHQQERWQRAAQEASSTLRLDPLRGAAVCLPIEQRLESAWVLPWKRLESDAPCRLQDLLEPSVLETLPLDFFPAPVAPARSDEQSRPVIQGQYAGRAEQVRGKGHLQSVPLVSLHLGKRHRVLLQFLYAAPLLSTEEIAALCALTRGTTTRLLYNLRTLGCIEPYQTRCGRRWRVSGQGLHLLARVLDVSVQHLAEGTKEALIQRGVPLLERTMHHTAGIYGFLARLHRDAARQGHQVAWWETGSWCERRYHEQGAWHIVRPDAAFEYLAGPQRIRAWLEWDEGTMTGGALAVKVETYAHYLFSREWARWHRALPLLLIVTPEPGQERRVRRRAEALEHMGLHLYTTTVTRLADQGPLAAIWLALHAQEPGEESTRRTWLDGNL